jgi:2-haloacid dehalogenase
MLVSRGSLMPNDSPATSVLAFDVYGTLIDPFHMETYLRDIFREKAREASELWRSKQLEYSFRRVLMKKYVNFDICTAQALRFVCEQFDVTPSEETLRGLLMQYLELPAYSDVPEALTKLEERGFKLLACSNGTENAVRGLLNHAGVLPRFSGIVSADRIGTFKPDPAVYEYLVAESHAPKETVCLISSNPFDVIGAKACGLRTAWVRRDPKRAFDPWELEPDVIVSSLGELLDKFPLP